MPTDDSRDPWERIPGEGTRAFAAFKVYLELGPQRSHAKVAKKIGKSTALVSRWSRRHDWVRRVDSWEDALDKEWSAAHKRLVRDTCKRHFGIGNAMLSKVAQRVDGMDHHEIEPRDIPRWVDTLIKAQRQGLGLSTSSTEMTGQGGGPMVYDVNDRREMLRPLLTHPEAAPLLDRLHDLVVPPPPPFPGGEGDNGEPG